ncbi:MAG: AraC family transcriptional regulator [Pseudomonadota bacterium]
MTTTTPTKPLDCIYQTVPATTRIPLEFDRHYLAYAAEGVMHLSTDEHTWSLQPTNAAWIPAHTRVEATVPSSIVCCSLLLDTTLPMSLPDTVQVIELSAMAREMVLHCRRWQHDEAAFTEPDYRFLTVLLDTVSGCVVSGNNDWIPNGRTAIVQRAITATRRLASTDVALADIAATAHASARTLSRRIRDETGMSWSSLLRRIRIIMAREQLATTDIPITDIAAAVGYASQSAFNRAFRADTGMAPAEFRASRLNRASSS